MPNNLEWEQFHFPTCRNVVWGTDDLICCFGYIKMGRETAFGNDCRISLKSINDGHAKAPQRPNAFGIASCSQCHTHNLIQIHPKRMTLDELRLGISSKSPCFVLPRLQVAPASCLLFRVCFRFSLLNIHDEALSFIEPQLDQKEDSTAAETHISTLTIPKKAIWFASSSETASCVFFLFFSFCSSSSADIVFVDVFFFVVEEHGSG